MGTPQGQPSLQFVAVIRLSFFLFVGLRYPLHFDFGKSKKKKKKKKIHKSQQMLAGCDKKIIPNILFMKHWSFKMIKIEISAHYWIFWTQIYNFQLI